MILSSSSYQRLAGVMLPIQRYQMLIHLQGVLNFNSSTGCPIKHVCYRVHAKKEKSLLLQGLETLESASKISVTNWNKWIFIIQIVFRNMRQILIIPQLLLYPHYPLVHYYYKWIKYLVSKTVREQLDYQGRVQFRWCRKVGSTCISMNVSMHNTLPSLDTLYSSVRLNWRKLSLLLYNQFSDSICFIAEVNTK